MARETRREAFVAAWARGAHVIDAREPAEYAAGYVRGVRRMSLRTMPVRRGGLPTGRLEFVIRAGGNRGKTAADWMNSHGVDARPVAGGTSIWARGGPPVAVGTHEHSD